MGAQDGTIAIITGAAQGLGAAFARQLRSDGADVVLTDRREAVAETAAALDADHHIGDVANATHVRAVVDATLARHGRVDVLINNAGAVWRTGPLDTWSDAVGDYDELTGSNLRGAFLFGRAVAAAMIESGGGHIVNISSDHVIPGPGCAHDHGHGAMDLYNAAKWALTGLTYDWARSLRPHGIRVNAICPGATDTEMLRTWVGGDPDPAMVEQWMRPEQTARVVADLLAEGPTGRTGTLIGLYVGQPCVLPPAPAS